jgi:hypothetical protein
MAASSGISRAIVRKSCDDMTMAVIGEVATTLAVRRAPGPPITEI